MKPQNYQNHVRMHPAFHFVLLPMTFVSVIGAILNLFPKFRGGMELWYAIVLLIASAALAMTAVLMREYAKKVQDRVVRAEENFRHYMLTGAPLDARLTLPQIIALRFASDDEYPELCSRAAARQLAPDEIKRSIRTWRADHLRV